MGRPRDYHTKLSQRKTNIMWYHLYVYVCAQSCLTLCDPINCSPPVFFVCVISKHKQWSGLSFPPPGDIPYPRIETTLLCLLHWQGDYLPVSHWGSLKTKKQTNLFTKQKQNYRHRHQAYGYQRRRWDKLGVWNQKKNFPISLPHKRLHTFV